MHSIEKRKLANHMYSLIPSLRKVAVLLQVSHTSVSRWLKNPNIAKYVRKGTTKLSLTVETIRVAIINDPFISIIKMKGLIWDVLNISVSRELIRIAIKTIGMSRKKARFFSRPSNLGDKTKAFVETRDSFKSQGRYFVSLDETSFGRNGNVQYGYAPIGQQLRIKRNVPRMTTVSSLVVVSDSNIVKREEVTGSFNSERFATFLDTLDLPHGTVIMLDNVAFHHSKIAKAAADRKGFELLFTPPYSPWFNPIEEVFSIVKRSFYKHWSIKDAFESVNIMHCAAFFKHAFSFKGMSS